MIRLPVKAICGLAHFTNGDSGFLKSEAPLYFCMSKGQPLCLVYAGCLVASVEPEYPVLNKTQRIIGAVQTGAVVPVGGKFFMMPIKKM
jgi:hypothetical protein